MATYGTKIGTSPRTSKLRGRGTGSNSAKSWGGIKTKKAR